MRVVLLDGRPRPAAAELADHARRLRAADPTVEVSAVVYGPVTVDDPGVANHLVDLVVLDDTVTPPPPRGSSASRVVRTLRRVTTGSGAATQFGRRAGRGRARALLDSAGLVVALDSTTIRPAWHIGRSRPDLAVVYGVAAAEQVIRSLG